MKRYLYIFLLITLWTTFGSFAYAAVKYPFKKEIDKGKYAVALEGIKTLLKTDSTDCSYNFAIYKLQSKEDYANYNPIEAYNSLVKSQKWSTKKGTNWVKKGYDKDLYRAEYEAVGKQLYDIYNQYNSLSVWEQFLDSYPKLPANLKNSVRKIATDMAYKDACEKDNIYSYQEFLRKYPKSKNSQDVIKRIGELQVGSDKEDWHKWANKIEKTKAKEPQIAKAATLYLIKLLKQTRSVDGLLYGIKQTDTALRDSCILFLHDICTERADLADLKMFYNKVQVTGSNVFNGLKAHDQAVFEAFNPLFYPAAPIAHKEAFISTAAPYYSAFIWLQNIISPAVANKDWAQALATVHRFREQFRNDKRYLQLVELLEAKYNDNIIKQKMSPILNSQEGGEYVPILSGDGNTLMFCGKGRTDSLGLEDIYMSKREPATGEWTQPQILNELCTDYNNEAPISLSVDGNTLILFINGKLCTSQKTTTGWSHPVRMPANINFSPWQSDAMITSDGQALLFAARCATEREILSFPNQSTDKFEHTNIFVSLRQSDGSWGRPTELGATINTSRCDRAPFLHPDMKTLYFCSNGHGGLGGLDVYKSVRLDENSWTKWSEPVNIGKEINTAYNDCWYVISTDGSTAYFSAYTPQSDEDLYSLTLPDYVRPEKVATISGTLLSSNGKPIDAEIRWEDLQTHKVVGHSKTDPETGKYFIVLPQGKVYGYYINKDGYFPIANNIDLRNTSEFINEEENITVVTYKEMIEKEIPMPMNNLFFAVGKADILEESFDELNRVAGIIIEQRLKVEIGGHTDNTGSDNTNEQLSADRAKRVYDYLIDKGCDGSLLTYKGYGSKKPIDSNSTEKGRQRNRRVEIRFIK